MTCVLDAAKIFSHYLYVTSCCSGFGAPGDYNSDQNICIVKTHF